MNRLPIRLRLTLAFALAMAVVLAAVGGLLYLRLGDSLQEQVDDTIESRAQDVGALVLGTGSLEGAAASLGEDEFAQLVELDGSVVESVGGVSEAVVSAQAIDRALTGPVFVGLGSVPGLDGEAARMLVTRGEFGDGSPLVTVVGVSLEDRQEALDGLLAQLLVVGPLALLLSSLAGYFLAGAALRPVDAIRRRAAEVSSEQPGQRLPLPKANDEIRRLGETLNAMLARLEAGIARERRFVADASHELRTPLSLLQTELELALRRPRSRDEQEQALRSAAEEVDRLVRLAGDLLVLARADDGKLPLDLSRHVVREVLDAVAGRFDSRARAAGRSLEVDASPKWVISGDRLRIEQAVGNLVDNALRHGAGTIRVEATLEGDWFELSVSDEGAGFPAEFLPYAFERFSRAEVAEHRRRRARARDRRGGRAGPRRKRHGDQHRHRPRGRASPPGSSSSHLTLIRCSKGA